jgi:hypothetical protein
VLPVIRDVINVHSTFNAIVIDRPTAQCLSVCVTGAMQSVVALVVHIIEELQQLGAVLRLLLLVLGLTDLHTDLTATDDTALYRRVAVAAATTAVALITAAVSLVALVVSQKLQRVFGWSVHVPALRV